MSTPTPRPSRSWTTWGIGAAGVMACAVCCAGPLLALLGGTVAVSAFAAIWVPALALLALLAIVAILVVRRKRHVSACRSDTGPIALGVPTVGAPDVIAARSDS